MKQPEYPEYVIRGVRESMKQADAGLLTPYTGIKDMLTNGIKNDPKSSKIKSDSKNR